MAISLTSPAGIANMALSHIGQDTIENLDEQSNEAKHARVWYDFTRRQSLEAYDWNFARKRLTLALHGDTISETGSDPMAGVWGYRYQYPADCLVMRKMQNANAAPAGAGDATPFDVEGSLSGETKTILTDLQDAVGVYTYDATDTGLFSPLFVQVHSRLLASMIAYALTGKQKISTEQLQLYQILLGGAAASNANEQVSPPPRDADWIRGRTQLGRGGVDSGESIDTFADADN